MSLAANYGKTIQDYEVQHLLGKGGFASVYKARCLKTNQMVAIKIIDKNLIQGSGMVNRVKQEVEIHSLLKHPSVLELYTFFQDENYVYLVLELADNGELHRYMKQRMSRPFTESEAAEILRQVVEGLLYLHSHQIMHRDISLSNLLLNKDMYVKIADFGLATKLRRPDEKHTTMCGTPNYISPEVVSRVSHGLPADVWGVGCMLYTLLVGHPPFDTDAVQSTLTKVVMSDYQIPKHLSNNAKNLICSLLQKNPSERITLEQVLRHPFMIKAAGSAAYISIGSQNSYPTINSSADSGIVTFTSSNNSIDSRNSQRIRSVEKYTSPPLSQIQEEHQYIDCSQKSSNKYLFVNDSSVFKSRPAQSDNMEVKWHKQPSAEKFEINSYFMPHVNHLNNSDENQFLPLQNIISSSQMIPGIPINNNTLAQKRVEKISVPPLDTKRLLPTRYKTKNAVMSILQDGSVVVEFIKFKSKLNEDRITDVCKISSDGQRIVIYQPDPGRGYPLHDQPLDVCITDEDSVYNYHNLPSKHWKKYIYAARFVTLVKSKTPKVTYFSVLAKCHLMESMIDFEVCFYTGAKVTNSPNDGIKVYNKHGMQLSKDSSDEATMLMAHTDECFKHCLAICNALEMLNTTVNLCFPVVIGRRPHTEVTPAQRTNVAMRDTTNFGYSTPKVQQGSINYSISTISSTRSNSSPHSAHMQVLSAQSNVPIKRINIPGVGTATELSHGVVQVQFQDGSLISVIPETQGGGVTYTQSNGVSTYFGIHDDLPLMVRDRIAHLPQVERELKCAPLASRRFENYLMAKTALTPSTIQQPMKYFR